MGGGGLCYFLNYVAKFYRETLFDQKDAKTNTLNLNSEL